MQKKTIRTRMKRSIALILALSMLFSEAATSLASEPIEGFNETPVIEETVDVSGGDSDVSDTEAVTDEDELIISEEQADENEITIVETSGYRNEFYYGLENDHTYFVNSMPVYRMVMS